MSGVGICASSVRWLVGGRRWQQGHSLCYMICIQGSGPPTTSGVYARMCPFLADCVVVVGGSVHVNVKAPGSVVLTTDDSSHAVVAMS